MHNINLDANRFAITAISTMFDTCLINSSASTTNSLGEIIKTYTSGSMSASSICGIDYGVGSKTYGDTIKQKYDATIRLPLTTDISSDNTVTIGDKTYNIVDSIVTGHGQLIVHCNRVTL